MKGADFTVDHSAYRIRPARYARAMVVVEVRDSVADMKGNASYLAEAVGGRWTNRECGYVMSVPKAKRFVLHFAKGTKTRIVFDSVYSSHVELVDDG